MKNTGCRKISAHRSLASAGFTLIELMVGVTVGLMVMMVAVYAIFTARKASGTVTDVAAMKQQASYVMYVLGSQIRQTGSMDAVQESAATATPGMPPMFYFPQAFAGLPPGGTTMNPVALQGTDGAGAAGSDTLSIAIRPSPVLVASQTDCLGNTFPSSNNIADYDNAAVIPDVLMTFRINIDASDNRQLFCDVTYSTGGGASAALAQNVTDFQVKYRYRQNNTTTTANAGAGALGIPPGSAGNVWDNVNAVEICIEMQGTEQAPLTGAQYTNCRGQPTVQGNRLTRVYRSLYNFKVSV